MKRITSIDAVRGFVMLAMALDHVRDLIHFSALSFDPTDLSKTSFPIFATRWITHLCAPTFVFLSGVSAYLAYSNSKDKNESRHFLWKRGVWLILLEVTWINFAIWFDIHFRLIMLQVIAAIGFSFILLIVFINRSAKYNIVMASIIILVCNFVVGLNFPDYPGLNFLYHLFFSSFLFQFTSQFMLLVGYPILPWFGIMLAGYSCGVLFSKPKEERLKLFVQIGGSLLMLFIIIRAVNVFGDPVPFSFQKNGLFSILSFINVSKYPPSLLYTLITLSVAFFMLYFSEKFEGKWKKICIVYGSVPMFYYLIHFYLIHIIAQLIMLAQGFAWSDFQFEPFKFGRPAAPSGISLAYVYLVWLCVVAMLYPLCKKYAGYKKTHPEKGWLKYI